MNVSPSLYALRTFQRLSVCLYVFHQWNYCFAGESMCHAPYSALLEYSCALIFLHSTMQLLKYAFVLFNDCLISNLLCPLRIFSLIWFVCNFMSTLFISSELFLQAFLYYLNCFCKLTLVVFIYLGNKITY